MITAFALSFCPARFRRMQLCLFLLALACLLLPIPARAQVTFTGPQPSVNFGSQPVRSPSAPISLPFTIAAGTKVGRIAVLTTGIAAKDLANATGTTCTATTYATATNCVVNVSFKPLATGLRRGAVVFYSGAHKTALATVPVFGIGTGPQVAFGPGGAQTIVEGKFVSPAGVAVDGAGNVYVTDRQLQAVFMVTPGGVETQVGSGLFSMPMGVAVDGAGNVYVSDPWIDVVYEVTPSGTQTSVGGGYNTPAGVAVDAAGNVYVADSFAATVFKITPDGTQTSVNGTFMTPAGVAVDAAGNVYVTDAGTDVVYQVTPGGEQTTVSSGLNVPDGLAIDGSGNVYIANTFSEQVLKVDRADAPSLSFHATKVGSTSKDSPKTVEVENIGNASLAFSALTYPVDFPEGSLDDACTSTISLAAGSSCALTIDFSPVTPLDGKTSAVLNEVVMLRTNTLNVAHKLQKVDVTGTEKAK